MRLNEKASLYMHEVNELLSDQGVTFWLDCGTLLGAIRNNSFIEGDNDIDFAAWEKDLKVIFYNDIFYNKCRQKGFQVYLLDDKFVFEKKGIPINVSYFRVQNRMAYRTLLATDKFYQTPLKAIWWVLSVKSYNKLAVANCTSITTVIKHVLLFWARLIPKKSLLLKIITRVSILLGCKSVNWVVNEEFFSDLEKYIFYGQCYYIPSNTYEYLSFQYGDDWHIEKKRWDPYRESGSVKTSEY